jgi:two-component system, LytTR family, response regulator
VNLRVAVVDDEEPARERLCQLLGGRPDVTIAAVCDGGRAAIAALESTAIDVVFLDIQMPEIDGFQVIEALGPRLPVVVFVTAFEAHAVHAFEVRALDYLLKPFDAARLEQALSRARLQLDPDPGPRPPTSPAASRLHRLLVRDGDVIHVVQVADVDWIAAAGNYVELHAAGRNHLLRATMAELEARLPPAFARVHRDTIVQLDRVCTLHRFPGGQYRLVLRDGTERPVGRSYQAQLESRLGRP